MYKYHFIREYNQMSLEEAVQELLERVAKLEQEVAELVSKSKQSPIEDSGRVGA